MPEIAESATARIDAHLASLPADQRDALKALRETIAAAAPEAVEAISYGMPAFKYRGRGLLWFEAFAKHCSLFPGASVHNYTAELEGFTIAKGTIHFTPDHPIPPELVTRMVRDKMVAIDAMLEARKKA